MMNVVFVTFVRQGGSCKESFVGKDLETILEATKDHQGRSYYRIRYNPDYEVLGSEAVSKLEAMKLRRMSEAEKVKNGELAYAWLGSHD